MGADATNDTDPQIEALQVEGFRSMSTAEKLRAVDALSRFVTELAVADVRRRFPHDSERDQRLRAASRWIEPDVMRRAFGWDVRQRGY